MPEFIGDGFVMKNRDAGDSIYAKNTRGVEITTEGILEGLQVVMDTFEKSGVVEELKNSQFYYVKENGSGKGC